MARRGQCRCGTILRFKLTSQGYKTRCPLCKAIVRLRIDEVDGSPPSPRQPKAKAPPLASELTELHGTALPPRLPAPTEPVDLSILSEHESSAPVALLEMETYRDPDPPIPSRRLPWWLFGLAVMGVILAIGTATVLLS